MEGDLIDKLFQETARGHLYIESNETVPGYPVVHVDGRLYFERFWRLENELVAEFKELLRSEPEIKLSPSTCHTLNNEQNEAIRLAMSSRLTFITGGPGTGKTYTAATLIKEALAQAPHLRIAIAAPTGRAVGQLKQSLGSELVEKACTLHRLLELWHNEADLLPYDLILADEASMIDLEMMIRLFQSLKAGARLILMGDPNQLPPVEAGSVFADLADFAPRAHLKKCLRAELQEIVDFAELVRLQDADGAIKALKSHSGPIIWKNSSHFAFPINEMPLLTPLKRGRWGSDGLNSQGLRENPQGPYPIMITRNQDKIDLYNGDRGTLFTLDPKPGDKALFGSRTIPALFLAHYTLAWALSIHKSQGSEFEAVRALFPDGSEEFGVAALYTAVTRAKRHVEIWAEEPLLRKVIETSSRRNSGIKFLLAV